MDKKIYSIADDDLGEICYFLEKIKSAAQSTYSHLDNTVCANEQINTVLCMLRIIEDLTNKTTDKVLATTNKLCVISKGIEKYTGKLCAISEEMKKDE